MVSPRETSQERRFLNFKAQMLREQRLAGGGKKGLQCAVTFLVLIQFSYVENTEREREREKKERDRLVFVDTFTDTFD